MKVMFERKKRIYFFFLSTLHANFSPKSKILFKKTQVLHERVLLFLAKKLFLLLHNLQQRIKHFFIRLI